MDFALAQEQQALAELARAIFKDHVTQERLRALEADGGWFDEAVWRKLAEASLLGVAVPEEHGGAGLGVLELGILLEEVGRAVAPVPVWASLVLGALPIAAFGSAAQRARWLPAAARGEAVLSAALLDLDGRDPLAPTARAARVGGDWRITGVKTCVPAGGRADAVLVPARRDDGGVGVFLVETSAPGLRRERQVLTNREPHARLELDGVVVPASAALGDGDDGARVLAWLHEHALAGLAAMQVGVCDRALRMTAEYTIERKQFDRRIASFQAVQQRAADAFIDVEAMRLAAWEALYRLSEGLPAPQEAAIAKFWAADGGQRAIVAAQHLHGGIGVDVDYPLHRYFLWAKHLELMLGPATEQLARLGAALAR